jgi:molybdate transport system substrate-binding protein
MDALVAGGRVTVRPTPFARNRMAIATKPGNPQAIEAVADLTEVGTVALCGATVPCGIYAARVLQKAGVRIPESRITRGADAKATLAAVARGDADATIVYATDVTAAGRMVTGVPIPEDANVTAVYPVAPLATSDHPRTAKAFVRFVVSPVGQRILARHGFLPV